MATVDYSLRGRIAVIAFQSPPVNSLGYALRVGLLAALDRAAADPAVDGIVLTGGNGTFSAGADIREFGSPEMIRGPSLWTLNTALDALPKPAVAAIEGMALGGGLEVSMSCHHRVALATARIGLPEVKLGLLPGAGGTQRLPRAVSKSKAMDMCLTARMMDAAEAERAGLVSRVVSADKLVDEALEAATVIAAMSLPTIMMIKESVNRAYESSLTEGVLFERRMFHSTFGTDDQKEGMKAFLEKRQPNFNDR